jgi:hypothetical protein
VQYVIETKTSAKGKWRPVGRLSLDRDDTLAFAREMDEHGNCVRVREHGHADGMSRTLFVSIGGR